MQAYKIDPNSQQVQTVGRLPDSIIKNYNLSCPSNEVLMYPGVIKHLKKRDHYSMFLTYHEQIPDIITSPDYVGQNPKEPNSIELYKVLDDHLLIAIKLDPQGYFFLSSFYDLNNGEHKIQKRLASGRIVEFSSLR